MVDDRQNVRGLRFLATLIGHRFAALLGNGVTTIDIQHRGVQLLLDPFDTVLPHLLQAAITAPLAKMVVHCPPRDVICLFNRHFGPLATRMQAVQHVIEHLIQPNSAHIASSCCAQKGQNVRVEFCFRYTGRDGAHRWLPLVRFFRL